MIALRLAGKLLKTKDAVRLALDRLGTVGSVFIQFIFQEEMNEQPGEITLQKLTIALSQLCRKFPDFRPFCP